jgi:hypothetical protein
MQRYRKTLLYSVIGHGGHIGGTDEVYFMNTEQPEHKALYLMANSSKYGYAFISFNVV